jgi:2-alkyl-3-oxoalkanoate reductase
MRVFVAGASGAIGTRLVPQLIDAGYDVIGTYRSSRNAERVRALGAEPLQLDLLDRDAVIEAVVAQKPDAIVNEATALADVKFSRNLDRSFVETNRLRTEGTDALLAAAPEAGVPRFVAQSGASYGRYAREGGPVKTEDDPIDPAPVKGMRESFAARRRHRRRRSGTGACGLARSARRCRRRRRSAARCRRRLVTALSRWRIWSFIHLDDAAAATVLALEPRRPGDLQHRRRRARPGARVAAGAVERARRQAAPPRSPLARTAGRRRGGGDDGNGVARRLER